MKALFTFLLAASPLLALAQSVGIGTATPNASAALEISATSKGLLVPRISLASLVDNMTIPSPAPALLVYNTNAALGTGFYYNAGTGAVPAWTKLQVPGEASGGDWALGGNTLPGVRNFGTKSNHDLPFVTNSVEHLRLTTTGYLGINTTAPAATLHVGGLASTVQLEGLAGSGTRVVTADIVGRLGTATAASLGDNLGNHLATQPLNLAGNALVGTGSNIGSTVGLGVRADGGLNIGQNTNNNVFVGYGAGASNTTGTGNHFVGYRSGYANTTGDSNFFEGSYSGAANTTGSYNLFVGQQSGYANTTGTHNFFAGFQSGSANTTGGYNHFVGHQSGFSNTTGTTNFFVGEQSGVANTTGNYNFIIGQSSGVNNTTGSYNYFSGNNSGASNTTGEYNQFAGFQSGFANTTGSNNYFAGFLSGYANTTGSGNQFMGTGSGQYNQTGSDNLYVGRSSGLGLPNSTGSHNLFVGHASGYRNDTGTHNEFLGRQAGYANTSGSYNFFAGDSAGSQSVSGSRNLYLGYLAGAAATTTDDNLAIGYQAGAEATGSSGRLHAVGCRAGLHNTGRFNLFEGYEAGRDNASGEGNVALGYRAAYLSISGEYNTSLGVNAGGNALSGTANVYVGALAGSGNLSGTGLTLLGMEADVFASNLTNAAAIGYRARVSANNALVLGGTGSYAVNVGIGLTGPAYPLHVAAPGGYDAAKFEAESFGPHLYLTRTGLSGSAIVDYIGDDAGNGAARRGTLELRGVKALSLAGNGDPLNPDLYINTAGNTGLNTTAPSSTLTVNGAVSVPYTDTGTATSFTLTNAHQTLRRFGLCASISIPQASTCPGRLYTIINSNGTGSSVTLNVQTSGAIYDDVTNTFIGSLMPNTRITIQSDGTNWIVVGR